MTTDPTNLTILRGDGSWPWHALVDGHDILVLNARATAFGGSRDPQDGGQTASGVSTRLQPGLMACALPMAYSGTSRALRKALGGSPIPRVPWKTKVLVTDLETGRELTVPVIDLGPAKRTGNALDLTVAAARHFDPRATATRFELKCHYRIIGGARFLATKGSYT